MTESEKITWALQQFLFAAKFVSCCHSEKIDFNLFRPKATFIIENDVVLDIPEWDVINQDEFVKGAVNQLMISFGACAIAVDDALISKYTKSSFKNWKNNPSKLNSLREVIFLIRSAYAHTMPDVHWYIDSDRNTANYVVDTPDGKVIFDANGKHGTKLKLSHFGGLEGFIHLVCFASDSVR